MDAVSNVGEASLTDAVHGQTITLNLANSTWAVSGLCNPPVSEAKPFQPIPLPLAAQNRLTVTSCQSGKAVFQNGLPRSQNVAAPSNITDDDDDFFMAADPDCRCQSPIASNTMKALRSKGSSFLRRHASKHGLPNASRKLTSVVLSDIAQHYLNVHKFALVQDEQKLEAAVTVPPPFKKRKSAESFHAVSESGPSQVQPLALVSPNNQHHRLINTGGNNVSLVETTPGSPQQSNAFALLPQQEPVPSSNPQYLPPHPFQPLVSNTLSYQNPAAVGATMLNFPILPVFPLQQDRQVLNANSCNIATKKVKQEHQQQESNQLHEGGSEECQAPVQVRTLSDLNRLNTSTLRPEASTHKVYNASRKPKKQVVDELWNHYTLYHSKDLFGESGSRDGCVGNVVDDEEENNVIYH